MDLARAGLGLLVASTLVLPAALASAAGTTSIPTSSTPTTSTTVASRGLTCATDQVSTWSLARLANETVAVSVNAMNIGAMGPAAAQGFGGILLFGTSAPANLGAVLARLQAMTPEHSTLLVMTDEEGGGVQRLTNLVGPLPWAQTMGKTLNPAQIMGLGARVGRALHAAGVNVDLAPVLDVDGRAQYPGAANPDGLRSFGATAQGVGADGVAFERGLGAADVTAVVKHFPGLGGATRNTDYGPARTLPWATLQQTGLVPFERAIASGVPAIMVSNASIPGLSALPATLSPVVVQELRQTLGFRGLLVADSLSAGAIGALHLAPPGAAVEAISAGIDFILYGSPSSPASSLTLAHQIAAAIVRAVTSGALARVTLEGAAAHVLATRTTLSCAK